MATKKIPFFAASLRCVNAVIDYTSLHFRYEGGLVAPPMVTMDNGKKSKRKRNTVDNIRTDFSEDGTAAGNCNALQSVGSEFRVTGS